jgi:hypothetical protein
MLVQVYGDNAMNSSLLVGDTYFLREEKVLLMEERSGQPATSRIEEKIAKFIKLCMKIVS